MSRHTRENCHCGGFGFVFMGYGKPVKDGCSRPTRMVSPHTGETYSGRCRSARPSRCEHCATIHKGNVAAVARSGWTDSIRGRGYWCALTAPGEKVLPFDRTKCTHHPDAKCSGKDFGCVVEDQALAIWHDDLGLRWSHFVHDLRRLLNPGATGPVSSWPLLVEFFKTYEPQARGALHAHFMIRLVGVVTDRRFRAAFRLAARRHGFGDQLHCEMVDISNPENAARKAGYSAKYATKCADVLPAVRRLNPSTGEIRSGGFRSWSASRGWGDTMKSIVLRQRAWAATSGGTARKRSGTGTADGGGLDLNQDHYASGVASAVVCDVLSSDQLV